MVLRCEAGSQPDHGAQLMAMTLHALVLSVDQLELCQCLSRGHFACSITVATPSRKITATPVLYTSVRAISLLPMPKFYHEDLRSSHVKLPYDIGNSENS